LWLLTRPEPDRKTEANQVIKTMLPLTLNQAAKACHKSKATILADIRLGRLSAGRDDKNQWQIDPSELFRVYPQHQTDTGNGNRSQPPEENRQETALVDALREQIDLLKAQLDRERDQLQRERDQADHWRKQATMLLTRQPDPAETGVVKSLLFEKLFGKR
jgi:hypothetical protein